MARYSKDELLKIDYFKSRIKEMRYLNYEIMQIRIKIDDIDCKLRRISSPNTKELNITISNKNIDDKWNRLITEKQNLIIKKETIQKELDNTNSILNSLTPNIRLAAIDLFIKRCNLDKIRDKYFISNPYQSINDELRYLEIDKF